jgi:hypothetical protein
MADMRKTLCLASVAFCAVALAGYESQAEKEARFLRVCGSAQFSAAQCEFLLIEHNRDADESESAQLMAGAALGFSASAYGGRR